MPHAKRAVRGDAPPAATAEHADARPRKRLRGKLPAAAQETAQRWTQDNCGPEITATEAAAAEEGETRAGDAAEGAGHQPAAEGFPSIGCVPAELSLHPRARIREELEKLSRCLREEPTVPADPGDPEKPWAAALLEDAAVQLPKKHCASQGCLDRQQR